MGMLAMTHMHAVAPARGRYGIRRHRVESSGGVAIVHVSQQRLAIPEAQHDGHENSGHTTARAPPEGTHSDFKLPGPPQRPPLLH